MFKHKLSDAGMNHFKSFFYLIISWNMAVGMYLLIRFHGTKDTMDWASSTSSILLICLICGSLLGIVDGILLAILERPKLRRRSYGFAISVRVITMFLTAVLIVFISRLTAYISGNIEFSQLFSTFIDRLTHKAVLPFLLYLVTVSALFSLIRQMSNMVGGRVLMNLMLGKYHHPKDEDRIFMFLDLKSSTTHAERLGHTLFCQLIQDCFHDLTESAMKNKVEIYQYVGDEAILTWTIKDGVKDENCINVFFDFQRTLVKRSDSYLKKYSLIPEFKAGVNYGAVTVAEVGDIKRDIAYLSDVLNTAARIQGKCNEYGEALLISSLVKDILPNVTNYKYKPLGLISLKGKQEKVEVFSVEKKSQ
jgi:adenylate cyclase